MTTFYVVDSYEARLRRKNAFLESKAAEEKAIRYACALNRPVSVYEVNNARESEWPVVKKAQQYWGMAKPTGEFEKSKDGKNPFTAFMDEQTQKDKHEDVEYHEDKSVETALRMRIEASLKQVKSVQAAAPGRNERGGMLMTQDHSRFIYTDDLKRASERVSQIADGADGLAQATLNAQRKHSAGGAGFNMEEFLSWTLARAKKISKDADDALRDMQLSSGGFGSAATITAANELVRNVQNQLEKLKSIVGTLDDDSSAILSEDLFDNTALLLEDGATGIEKTLQKMENFLTERTQKNNGKTQGKFMTTHSKQEPMKATADLKKDVVKFLEQQLKISEENLNTAQKLDSAQLQVAIESTQFKASAMHSDPAGFLAAGNVGFRQAFIAATSPFVADAAAPAVAHHLQSGDVALVDKKDKAFVIDSAEGIYVILLNGSVTQFPDDPNRIAAVHGEDPHKKQWKSFIQVLLKQQGVNKLEELDSEQKTRFYDLAKRKWPKVEKRMNHHEKPLPQHPKEPQPEAESSFSLAKFCNDLCKNDFEQAAALEEHVRASVRNDAVKAHAMSLLRNWGLYVLPRGWYDTAKACFENERKVAASRKLSAVDMVPPVAVRAEATSAITRALKEGVALPAYTQKLARSVATGSALDLGTIERMSVFFQTQSDKERAWAAWGGNTGKAWVESLKQKI